MRSTASSKIPSVLKHIWIPCTQPGVEFSLPQDNRNSETALLLYARKAAKLGNPQPSPLSEETRLASAKEALSPLVLQI